MTPTANAARRRAMTLRTSAEVRPIWSIRRPVRNIYVFRLKRVFDLAFCVLSFPVVLPLALLIAIVIKLDSPGPVLVKLQRLGKGGRLFGQYKFRTMVVDAEQMLRELLQSDPEIREEFEATYKIKKDPRVTCIGRLLRKTSLDELPQILNVLKGDMSWVGPRAIRPDELKMYGDVAPIFLSAVPGITGLWQVSGRSKLSYEERVRLDIHYIENIGFGIDLRIVLRTFPAMFTGNGAF